MNTQDPMLSVRHAVENASRQPVSDGALLAMLAGAPGPLPQMRALFEDNSLRALASAGRAHGVCVDAILAAYAAAKETAAAANPELDEALAGRW